MKLSEFDYILPEELIAKHATENRSHSRLLMPQSDSYNEFEDKLFEDIINYLSPNDLLVLNNSKVIKARLFGNKPTGGKIEIMVERVINSHSIIAHVRSNKSIPIGMKIILPDNLTLIISNKLAGLFELTVDNGDDIDFYSYLEIYGNLPLPPYINRHATKHDDTRYQTVYAKTLGSVAAPTAGLHFNEELLHKIQLLGVKVAFVTLHVGSGTFKPVSVDNIYEHKMHSEMYHISQETLDLITECKANNGKIISVGTTSLRTLESVAKNSFKAGFGETDIFITPGFKFKIVDQLITNFHLPKSTLLMLVSAFSGMDEIKKLYQYAITHKYRFFSYGDAMLLSKKENNE